MKILSIAFLFLTLVTSSAKEESNVVFFECLAGSMDYCTGYADGHDEASGWNMSIEEWRATHNGCMIGRGCQPHFIKHADE